MGMSRQLGIILPAALGGHGLPYLRNNLSKRCKSSYENRELPEDVIKETKEQCDHHKKLTKDMNTEQSCLADELKCERQKNCEPDDCDNIIPEDVFQGDSPIMSPEEKQRKICFKNSSLHCLSWEKTYPMRHAGIKPPIDGRPIIGQTWKRKKWGIKC